MSNKIFGIALCILALSCSSTENNEEVPASLGTFEMGVGEEYIKFNEGDRWVFQDEISAEFDTITFRSFKKYESGLYNPKAGLIYSKPDYQILWTSSLGDFHIFTLGPCSPTSVDTGFFKFFTSTNGNVNMIFFYPFREMVDEPCLTRDFDAPDLFDSMELNNIIYREVARFTIDEYTLDTTGTYKAHYYWARGAGLVRISLFDENDELVKDLIRL
ncbi:hypothetical protein GYB22_03345 [bacterium]|nr:hypothetical protein [bacterium]